MSSRTSVHPSTSSGVVSAAYSSAAAVGPARDTQPVPSTLTEAAAAGGRASGSLSVCGVTRRVGRLRSPTALFPGRGL